MGTAIRIAIIVAWLGGLALPFLATLGAGVGLGKLARRYARVLGPGGAAPASHRP